MKRRTRLVADAGITRYENDLRDLLSSIADILVSQADDPKPGRMFFARIKGKTTISRVILLLHSEDVDVGPLVQLERPPVTSA